MPTTDSTSAPSTVDLAPTAKGRAWQILEPGQPGDRVSRFFDGAMLVLILLNVLAVIFGTVHWVEEMFGPELMLFEWFSVAIFTVEYIVRIWSCTAHPQYAGPIRGRLRWVISPMALVDLIAVAPFYLPIVGLDFRAVRSLRLLRIFRLLKLGRYVSAMQLFADVARSRREEMVLTSIVVILLLVLTSSLMYFAEHHAQPEAFQDIPTAMWWSIATLTTVGYGDIYPITPIGKVLGAFSAVLGIGLFALPTAILGTGFLEEIQKRKNAEAETETQKEGPTCPHCGQKLND